jgi:predicted MFS family arabinose efflux permease
MSSISIILDQAVGWRMTVRIISFICLAFVISQLFVKEPIRNATNMLEKDGPQAALENNDTVSSNPVRLGHSHNPSQPLV